jgi:hypothetical protein
VECESKSDTVNNKGDWKHFKITQTIPEQHTWKAQNQGTAKKTAIMGTAHKVECANVKVQNIFQE